MITLHVTEDQAHMIRYALGELANRRQEQAINFMRNDVARACTDEAGKLRQLQQHIADKLPPVVCP